MTKKLKDWFLNKTALIVFVTSFAVGSIYGFLRQPFYLHFIDGMTFASIFFLAAALVRSCWLAGDFTFFTWHPKKNFSFRKGDDLGKYQEDPTRGLSYREYRAAIRKERKDMTNEFLPPTLLVLVIVLLMSYFY